MNVYDFAPGIRGHFIDHGRAHDACIVHEAVHGPEMTYGAADSILRESRVAHAAEKRQEALFAMHGAETLKRALIEFDRSDISAQFKTAFGDRFTDTLPGAGN